MNFAQLQRAVSGRLRSRPASADDHLSQTVRDIINSTVQDILSRQDDWPFMYRTAEIITVTGETDYALPSDFGSLQHLSVNHHKVAVYPAQDFPHHHHTASSDPHCHHQAATIRQLTTVPFYSVGTVYPTFDSSEITGIGTAFDSRVVGRFFRSARDGEIYRVKSITDALTIHLMQDFKGRSQAGRVSLFGNGMTTGDLSLVIGSPNVTNFVPEMTGRLIQIEGEAAAYTIDTVDTLRQRLTLTAPISVQGTDRIYSIQDDYEIDPEGQFILHFNGESNDDDDIIRAEYIATQTEMTGDNDLPLIPRQFHQVIVFGATAEALRVTNWPDANTIQMYEQRYEAGINSLRGYDPLGVSVEYTAEPDPARQRRGYERHYH